MNAKIDDIIRKITEKNYTLLCISPHLDDAALSIGGLLGQITNKIVNITVFTMSSELKDSLSVKAFLKQCGYNQAKNLYIDRISEDKAAFSKLNADSYHLGQIDALWRPLPKPNAFQKLLSKLLPEFLYTYPIYRVNVVSGKVSKNDKITIENIESQIKNIAIQNKNPILLCPIGIGKNVDHILVRDLCLNFDLETIYWSDFPYNLSCYPDQDFIQKNNLQQFEINFDQNKKNNFLREYRTQFKALFKDDKVPIKNEIIYLNQEFVEKILSK